MAKKIWRVGEARPVAKEDVHGWGVWMTDGRLHRPFKTETEAHRYGATLTVGYAVAKIDWVKDATYTSGWRPDKV